MGKHNSPAAKGCAILVAFPVAVLLLVVAVVGVKTWVPLQDADRSLEELDQALGPGVAYLPPPAGAVPPERMAVFLELRRQLIVACGDYGAVQEGFDSVASLETMDPEDLGDVGGVAKDLGGASLNITPFLARFFERRNQALLDASMGLEEYGYIFAVVYREELLSPRTRRQIFSDGLAASPEAALRLKACLERQRLAEPENEGLARELDLLEMESGRLIWQDGLPPAVEASVAPWRDRLALLFCSATAGLEMERGAKRALRIALE